jgi:hypothetical protein
MALPFGALDPCPFSRTYESVFRMNEESPSQPSELSRKSIFHQAAKASWISFFVFCAVLVLGRNMGSTVIKELVSLTIITLGMGFGVAALFGIRRYGAKGILFPAISGIIINGFLILIFATNFTAARTKAQQNAIARVRSHTNMALPFQIVAPTSEWDIDNTTRKIRDNAFIVASAVKTNSALRTVAIRYNLSGSTDSIFQQLSTEMRRPLAQGSAKKASEKSTTFLTHKAVNFTYEMTQNGRNEFYDVMVFATDNVGWAVLCVGAPEQRDEVERLHGFYQPVSSVRP